MGHPGKFIRDSAGFALSQYVARGVLFARGLAAAAALGPHGYGGWNALNLIFDYGSYASCGAIQGLDLKLPAALSEGDPGRARRLMSGAWSATIAGGSLFGLGLAVYLVSGGRAFSTWPGFALPVLMLAAAVLQLAFQYLASSLRAYGRFQAVSGAHATQAVMGGGLGLALVWSHGPWGLLWGWIAGTVLALAWMRRRVAEAPLLPAGLRESWSMVRAGFPIFGFFATTLVLRSVDRLALVRYADSGTLGLYGVGLMAVSLVFYLPEAAAYVLFPRIAAAHHGSGDRERTRAEVVKAHRALALGVPLVVGLGMIWAGPVVAWLLPAYREGVPTLRVLAIGAMALSAATIPAYFMLAAGRQGILTGMGTAAAILNATLVFTVAAGDPRPQSVAVAAVAGHTLFALGVLARVAREWFDDVASRLRLGIVTLVPVVWITGTTLVVCSVGRPDSWIPAGWRSVAVVLAYVPIMAWLGRGVGLRGLVREWLVARGRSV